MPTAAVPNERLAAGRTDPLELLGGIVKDLVDSPLDLEFERVNLRDLSDLHGAAWVWDNRYLLEPLVRATASRLRVQALLQRQFTRPPICPPASPRRQAADRHRAR